MEDAKLRHANDIGKALQAVGELLAADDFRFGIVVIGGAALNLDAAADQPTSNNRHFRDLVALNPSGQEIAIASEWVHEKNIGVEHHTIIDRVVAHVTSLRK